MQCKEQDCVVEPQQCGRVKGVAKLFVWGGGEVVWTTNTCMYYVEY